MPPRGGSKLGRTGADLFRRPRSWRGVDDPPAHHLRVRDRAIRRARGRLLAPLDRRIRRQHQARPTGASGCGRDRAGVHGHAPPAGRRLGVDQLEVPQAGQGGRDDIRALDADSETCAGGWFAIRNRCLAGRRPHGGRGALRRRRGWSQRVQEVRPDRREGRRSPGSRCFAKAAAPPHGNRPRGPARGRAPAGFGRARFQLATAQAPQIVGRAGRA